MEKSRLRLGVVFNFDPTWMGGIIYVLNLIQTLNYLDEDEKPEIVLFYRPELEKFLDQIKYPHLRVVKWNFPSIGKGYLKSWINRKNFFYDNLIEEYSIDALYPSNSFPVKTRSGAKVIAWYADLQHKYYPEFFSKIKLLHRNVRIFLMLKNASDLVVSSNAVKNDFYKFYKIRADLKLHVYHFTSVISDFSSLNIEEVKERYKLPDKYFMVSNQFHKHKNHKVLLEAMVLLKNKNINIHLAMTGRFPDPTHSPYMAELHKIIRNNNLDQQISLLGIIPRNEQLLLMKHSQAVLQPSLFEGWSTVIEDAISMQVPVIASTLPVNIEQLEDKGHFFDPFDAIRLAEIISDFPSRNLDDIFYQDYIERVSQGAKHLLSIFSS